jgi:hypothetical protein
MRKDFVQEERQELCYKQQPTIACSLEQVGGYCISSVLRGIRVISSLRREQVLGLQAVINSVGTWQLM